MECLKPVTPCAPSTAAKGRFERISWDTATPALDYAPPLESRHGDPELRRKYPLELIFPKNDGSMNSICGTG